MSLRSMSVALLLLALPGAALAQASPSPAELRQGLVGRWSGTLTYRDYQSDAEVTLPVETTISSPGDGATLIRASRFADGPGKTVWITTVALDDARAGTVTSASFRSGGSPAVETDTVRVAAFAGPTRWTLVYGQTSEDDDAPAEVRVTETRDGDLLSEVKEVRPVGSGDDAWRVRNQTRLTRLGD